MMKINYLIITICLGIILNSCAIEQKNDVKIGENIDKIFIDCINDNFYQKPDLGGIVSGWSMITPSGRQVPRFLLWDQAELIIPYGAKAVPHLFKWLKIDNVHVRYIAIYSLEEITGISGDMPYFASHKETDPNTEKKAIERWRKWYEAHSQDK